MKSDYDEAEWRLRRLVSRPNQSSSNSDSKAEKAQNPPISVNQIKINITYSSSDIVLYFWA